MNENVLVQTAMDSMSDRIEALKDTIAEVNRICQEYEDGGFNIPGKYIDEIRDTLGRRTS